MNLGPTKKATLSWALAAFISGTLAALVLCKAGQRSSEVDAGARELAGVSSPGRETFGTSQVRAVFFFFFF